MNSQPRERGRFRSRGCLWQMLVGAAAIAAPTSASYAAEDAGESRAEAAAERAPDRAAQPARPACVDPGRVEAWERAIRVELAVFNLTLRALRITPAEFSLLILPAGSTASPRACFPIRTLIRRSCRETKRGDARAADASPDDASGRSQHRAQLTLQLANAARPVAHDVDLSDVPAAARERTLAVALVELVRTTVNAAEALALERERRKLAQLSQKLESQRGLLQQQVAAEEQRRRHAAQHPVPLPGSRVRVGAAALATLILDGPTQMLGAELSSYLLSSRVWRGSAEASYVRAERSTDFGRLDVARWGLALGADWNSEQVTALKLGPRLMLAAIVAQGNSRLGIAEDRQIGWGVALGGRAALEVALSRRLLLRSTWDASYALLNVVLTAGGREAFNGGGFQATWGLGAGWNL